MKYTYAYKDSDGKRHEDSIEASSRDAAFAALREQGIRPIKVVAADGSKANGAPVGVRRRVVAVSILVAIVTAVAATAVILCALSARSSEKLVHPFPPRARTRNPQSLSPVRRCRRRLSRKEPLQHLRTGERLVLHGNQLKG